jgi:hypothetical protein
MILPVNDPTDKRIVCAQDLFRRHSNNRVMPRRAADETSKKGIIDKSI